MNHANLTTAPAAQPEFVWVKLRPKPQAGEQTQWEYAEFSRDYFGCGVSKVQFLRRAAEEYAQGSSEEESSSRQAEAKWATAAEPPLDWLRAEFHGNRLALRRLQDYSHRLRGYMRAAKQSTEH